MKITNKHGLPKAFFKAAATDTYSRGNSHASITQLIGPPRISILKARHQHEMVADAVDQIWTLLGTAVHTILERNSSEDIISEERLFTTINGWIISGAVDVQGNEEIVDYKVTGVRSVMTDKPEWERQLNCYGALVRKEKGIIVKRLRICAILRDWHRSGTLQDREYPRQPIQMVEVPVWSAEEQDRYLEERVRLHQDAAVASAWGDELPECSDEERWSRNHVWAVKKKDRVRALKLFDNAEEAATMVDSQPDLVVEFRPGKSVRCEENYCGVAPWCDQWKRIREKL